MNDIKKVGKIVASASLGCFFLFYLYMVIIRMIEELTSSEVSYSEATRKALLCYLAIGCIYCTVYCFKYAYEHFKKERL